MPTGHVSAGDEDMPQPTPWHTEILGQLSQLAQTQSQTAVTLATLTTRLAAVEQWQTEQDAQEKTLRDAQPMLNRVNAQLLIAVGTGCVMPLIVLTISIIVSYLIAHALL
jgi:hypothetical protein